MGKGHHDQVVHALREAPFDGNHWAVALKGVAAACGAASAQLLSFGDSRFAPIVAPGFSSEEIADFVALGGANPTVNHGLRAVQKSALHDIFVDSEYLDDEQRRTDTLYNEFFFRFDGEHVASATVAQNPGATCNINLFLPRADRLGEELRHSLRRLLPHFTQALRLTARLEGMAATLASGIWDELGEAALLCDASGGVIHANAEAERLLEHGKILHVHRGILTSRASAAPIRLDDAIAAATAADGEASAQRLILCTDHSARTVVDVMPLPVMTGLLSPLALVLVGRGSFDVRLDTALVEVAFGLTPAEQGVAEGLLQRLSSAEIAQRRNVSIETVNSQIKAILAKTDCSNRGAVTQALQPFLKSPR